MPITRTTLELYKDVSSGTKDETQTHTPSTGDFRIVLVEGQAAFDLNVAVIVDFDGTTVWLTKGSSIRTDPIELVGDGVKVLKLVLDCVDLPSGSAFLGGLVKIEQET